MHKYLLPMCMYVYNINHICETLQAVLFEIVNDNEEMVPLDFMIYLWFAFPKIRGIYRVLRNVLEIL